MAYNPYISIETFLANKDKFGPGNVAFISDVSGNLNQYLDLLQSNISKLGAIYLTYPTANLNVSAVQVANDAAVLKIINSYRVGVNVSPYTPIYKLAVKDTAENIAANIDALHSKGGAITSITPTTAPNLNISASSLKDDVNELYKLGSALSVNLDGSTKGTEFHFNSYMSGAISGKHYDTIKNWVAGDKISFGNYLPNPISTGGLPLTIDTKLSVLGSSSLGIKGWAAIDQNTGVTRFNATENTLDLQIAAVEKSISVMKKDAPGHVAMWNSGSDAFVLITDNHTGNVIGPGDNLIKLIGVSVDHLSLQNGVIVGV